MGGGGAPAAAPPVVTDWGHPRGAALKRLAAERVPLSDSELDEVLASLREAAASDPAAGTGADGGGVGGAAADGGGLDGEGGVDWAGLRAVLAAAGHRPHKEWAQTAAAGAAARACLLRGRPVDDPRCGAFRRMWGRVLGEGNWDGAVAAASARPSAAAAAAAGTAAAPDSRPWAVLVTGVNGIRKTTSLYQPWFPALLGEALAAAGHPPVPPAALPVGGSSWFRQLDHLIATVGAAEFRRLYAGTPAGGGDAAAAVAAAAAAAAGSGVGGPPLVAAYAAHKDGIFARYRTVAEVLGMALVGEATATAGGLNVLAETSGRDVAMFHYVEAAFPAGAYRRLALHFTVNNLDAAAASVAARMEDEMGAGGAAAAGGGGIHALIRANAGGPYGPEALPGVQADAERVWAEVAAAAGRGEGVAAGWWTARVAVDARLEAEGWTAQAAAPGGERVGERYSFVRLER